MSSEKVTMQEDGVSEGNTEDNLISHGTSRETVNSKNKNNRCFEKGKNRCLHFTLFSGVLMIVCGISSLVYTPYDFLLNQRIRMLPGLPPFEWWLHPPDEVLLKVYIFNVTNSEEFLLGTDNKLKLKEIGPIIYREKLTHTNPIFNDNGTLTYTANRSTIFLPELNSIDLNATIVMPNLGVLFVPVYFANAPFITKVGINMMMRSLNSHPFQTLSIQDFLWNSTDQILEVSQKLLPGLVPTRNTGILHTIYKEFEDNVTVYIGPNFGHKDFFLIDKYDGSEYLPHFGSDCSIKVVNSSEGVNYPQFVTKNDTLKYWRKSLCIVAQLHYTEEVYMYGVKNYRFNLSAASYDRTFPEIEDCYRGEPSFPSGISDISQCYYDTAIAASFPHFLYGDDIIKTYVDGLEPDVRKHGSYVIVEPNTGIPLHGIARSQINLAMKDMKGFNAKIQRFSNLTIPLVWLEYNQVGLPSYIQWLMYFTVILVPVFQKILTLFLFVLGLLFTYMYIRKKRTGNILKNKTLTFEAESFLNKKESP